jgi:hypothetical protein
MGITALPATLARICKLGLNGGQIVMLPPASTTLAPKIQAGGSLGQDGGIVSGPIYGLRLYLGSLAAQDGIQAADWAEELHPRGPGGKFAQGFGAKTEVHNFLKKTGWTHMGSSVVPGYGSGVQKAPEWMHPVHGKIWVGEKKFYHQPGHMAGTQITKKGVWKGPEGADFGKLFPSGKPTAAPVSGPAPVPAGMHEQYVLGKDTATWDSKHGGYAHSENPEGSKLTPAEMKVEIKDSGWKPAGVAPPVEKYISQSGQEFHWDPKMGSYAHSSGNPSLAITKDVAEKLEQKGHLFPAKEQAAQPTQNVSLEKQGYPTVTNDLGHKIAFDTFGKEYVNLATGNAHSIEHVENKVNNPLSGWKVSEQAPPKPADINPATGQPHAFDKLIEEKPKGPPLGMPEAIKGPKGGVYSWNEKTGMYSHSTGQYHISVSDAQSKLHSGYTAVTPPSKIPAGMHDTYQKAKSTGGVKWTAQFNTQTGMYDKYKNGMFAVSLTPEKFASTNVGPGASTLYKPTKGATLGTGESVRAPGTQAPKAGVVPAAVQPAVFTDYFEPLANVPLHTVDKNTGDVYHWDKDNTEYTKNGEGVAHSVVQTKWNSGDLQENTGFGKPAAAKLPEPAGAGKPSGVNATDFKLKAVQPTLGGAHEKYVFTDKQGNDWMFKPAQTLGGAPDKIKAQADEVAGKIQAIVRPGASVEAHAISLPTPNGEKYGSIQKMVSNVAATSVSVHSLSPSDIKQIQQEHVVDWLISNHDAHGKQFLKTDNGTVIGIDKTQAFKHFPNDQLSPNYHPNAAYGEQPPIYNQMYKAAAAGTLKLDPNDALPAIKNVMKMPDADYRQMLTPYAQARYGGGSKEFLDAAVARKNSLKSDFEKLYSGVLGKDFKFASSAPPIPTAAVGKVSPDLHEAMHEAGYQFEKLGAKTQFALYKENGEHAGKAVYVTDPKTDAWAFYPMGTQGTNPYGSSTGTGAAALSAKFKEPFEKPDTGVNYSSPTYKAPASAGLSPQAKSLWDSLPEKPYEQEKSGKPTAVTTVAGKISSTESSTLSSYKGSGYHSINGFLWQGGQAEHNEKIKALDSVMTKAHTNQDLVVWRNPGNSTYANQLKTYLLEETAKGGGPVKHEPSCFQSTSTSKDFSHNWAGGPLVLQIHLPKGSPGYPWDSESEIMIDRSAVYTVNHMFKSGGKLYADVNVEFTHTHKIKAAAERGSGEDLRSSTAYAKKFYSFRSPEEAELGMAKFLVDGKWVSGNQLPEIEPEAPQRKSALGGATLKALALGRRLLRIK